MKIKLTSLMVSAAMLTLVTSSLHASYQNGQLVLTPGTVLIGAPGPLSSGRNVVTYNTGQTLMAPAGPAVPIPPMAFGPLPMMAPPAAHVDPETEDDQRD